MEGKKKQYLYILSLETPSIATVVFYFKSSEDTIGESQFEESV